MAAALPGVKLGLRARILCATGVAVLLVLLASAVTVWFVVPAHERVEVLWHVLGFGGLIVIVVLALLAVVLQRWVVRPLARTVRVMDKVRRGEQDLNTRLSTRGGGEVAILNDGFNGLAQAIAQRDRELLAARQASDDGGRAKSQFMALMSHELRTPLNAVVGLAELLHGSQLDARQQRFVTLIRQSAHTLAGVIDDLLDAKRLDERLLKPVNAPFRLREAALAIVERYRDGADRRGLSLAVHFDLALPDVVDGDRMHVGQVLGNLLSNAVKFTEHGGVIVRVTPSGLGVRFSVSDTGVGIASDLMPHIYEAFRQADSSSTRRFGGTGLGLTIAHQLCVAMGGRIEVASRPGQGSTFWFDLPLTNVPGGMPESAPPPTPPAAAGART
ncbi:MAG: HAMP domain-containing protein [Burkholderiaceae bacterium]|nr:HAMP domain-containing protein [Burkholderiaceae bacterium]